MNKRDFTDFKQSLLEGLEWTKENKDRIKQKKILSYSNKETLDAIKETEEMLHNPNHKTFNTVEEMIKDVFK